MWLKQRNIAVVCDLVDSSCYSNEKNFTAICEVTDCMYKDAENLSVNASRHEKFL